MTAVDPSLRGRSAPWSTAARLALALCVLAGLWLRLRGLAAEGFGDDEVHKWLAANRYLHGDFGGDDVEHPMLMKWLITAALLAGSRLGWAPEAITRLPNALAGGLSILVTAQLGKRLFGARAGLFAGALAAASVTLIGYQRVAKEDTLLGLFLMVLLLCLAEARAAAEDGRAAGQRRWELAGGVALGAMLASKYFFFLTPIPVVFYLWVRRDSAWRVPFKRWVQLALIGLVVLLAISWTPLLPSTWEYARSYTTGQQTVHGSLFFMGRIYHNLVEYGLRGTSPLFYFVFAAVKLAPATLLFALAGLWLSLTARKPAHKLVLSWMAVWFFVHTLSGSKWGRFFTSVLPAFLILAGYATAVLVERLRFAPGRAESLLRPALLVVLALALPGAEAVAAIRHAPHYRLYISPLGGGDSRVTWYYPHCDYFDAGFREAVQYVAAHAEPGAELSTEIDWPARLYSERAGRSDLVQTLNRRGRACLSGHPCYVVVQTGRLYFLNEDAVRNLATRTPWHVERIRGEDVVKVYRLQPGESPYPAESAVVQH